MEKHYNLYFCLIDTSLGSMGIIASQIGLREVILPKPSNTVVYQTVLQKYGIAHETALSFLGDLPQRFELYFAGGRVDFPDALDLSNATDFQKSVWKATQTIPYGETRSYNWVAGESGYNRAARAVGQALGKNPFPIVVPCHRVIAGDGNIGGFSGGIGVKKYLLHLENQAVMIAGKGSI
jgi:methylated-DNA-[protein]-cysteine S-methyltransferase